MRQSNTTIAIPPGETIKEQLEDREMSQKEFAARMELSEKHVSKLINGEVQLTPPVAEKLEMVLGVPADFWNSLEAIYREKLAKVEAENEMDEDMAIAKNLPIREMKSNKWIDFSSEKSSLVKALRQFFEIARLTLLFEKPELAPIVYRRQSVSEKAGYALLAWAQQAKREARKVETKRINLDLLRERLPEIKKLSILQPEDFCPKLTEMLAACGIAIVFLPHIKGSFLHGAAFRDGKKIVVGMTVRGKYADTFWFSLFHELAHILHDDINKPEGVSEQEERDADAFARQTLIPDDDFAAFVLKKDFSRKAVMAFAEKQQVLSGVVIGRLQVEKHISFSAHNSKDIRPKYEIA